MKPGSLLIFVLMLITFFLCNCKSDTAPTAVRVPVGGIKTNAPAGDSSDNDKEKLLDMALRMSGKKLATKERSMAIRMLSLNEEDLIKGLRVCAEFSGGRYPTGLDHETVIRETETWSRAKYGKYDDLQDDRKREIDKKLYDTFFMATYYKKLITDNRAPAYYGGKVMPKDGNAVLMHWQGSDGKYRVVFGDLRVQTVAPERLAKMKKQLPTSNTLAE